MSDAVIVRMPPSPTGFLHLGTARTVLFNYLFSKSQNGTIVFRWEDTDLERSKTEFEEEILEGLAWLGMDFVAENTEFQRQTENGDFHQEMLKALWENEKIFPCFLTTEEIDAQREAAQKAKQNFVLWSPSRDEDKAALQTRMEGDEAFVWRLRVPKDQDIVFKDLIRGDVTINSSTIGDITVARADGSVLYPLANVLDDWQQGITHVIRGEDHIYNTPKQLLIWEALGEIPPSPPLTSGEVVIPVYGHIPLVLNHAGAKLSKRNVEPGTCILVRDFRAQGFLPQGVINGLAFLGWHPKTEEEHFSLEDLIERFDIKGINNASAKYDFEKMKWFNNAWMNQLDQETLVEHFLDWNETYHDGAYAGVESETLVKAISVCRQKAKTFVDLEAELQYLLFDIPAPDSALLANEKMKVTPEIASTVISSMIEILENWSGEVTADLVKEKCIEKIQELELKNGQFLWPVRYSLSGKEKSVSPFDMVEIFGLEESVERLKVMA